MFRFSKFPVMDDDQVSFDGPPDWLVPALRAELREAEPDGLGLRSLVEGAQIPPPPWPTARHGRLSKRAARFLGGRAPLRSSV
jgi:hypothetical protein